MSTSVYADADAALIAELRKKTDERIRQIRETRDEEITGIPVYYVSNAGNDENDGLSPDTAWETPAKASTVTGPAAVRFARGGIYRGQIKAQPGVTYAAYGEGPKPMIYGSPENGADASKWTQTADDPTVWIYETVFSEDVGLLVFDEGAMHATKTVLKAGAPDGVVTTEGHFGTCINMTWGNVFRDYHDLQYDLDFWHDDIDRRVYLKSKENPGKRFSSIEFNVRHNVIAVGGSNDVTVDNLCVKYGGCHGVGAGTVKNLTVKNCEFGWIGGAIQYIRDNRTVRFGNAVEIYGGCDNYSVTDCYVWQVYDAGITQQVGLGTDPANRDVLRHQKNMTYARNVIEYCNYSIEYFLGVPDGNPSRMEHFLIEDNYMWYAGTGVCEQRPDLTQGSHIKSWNSSNRATDYVIRNNVFVDSKDLMLHISSKLRNPDGSDSMPVLSGNLFLGREGGKLGSCAMDSTTWMPYDREILTYLGDRTHGDTFCFLAPDTVTQIGGAPASKASSARPRDFGPWTLR